MIKLLFIIIGILLIFMGLNIRGKAIGSLAFPMIIGGFNLLLSLLLCEDKSWETIMTKSNVKSVEK